MTAGIERRQGFTTIEILVVVVLIAIFGVVAIPLLSSSSDRKAEIEGAQIESILKHAQSLAMTRGENYFVRFFVNEGYLVLFDGAGGRPEPDGETIDVASISAGDEDYFWYLKYGEFESVDFGGQNRIEFSALGRAVSGGTVVIDYGDYGLTIDVEETTGCVTMQGASR